MKDKRESGLMIKLISLLIAVNGMKSDEICDAIVIDAITSLHNQTLVMFRKHEVWLLNRGTDLWGPCPVSSIFNEMKGPVDAALTITNHETIVEFIGASVYFQNGEYYTMRNLLPYQVEWGALIYLPHKGSQVKMGSTVPAAQNFMKTKISAAYFDPIDSRTKLVFSDASVLGFNFEFGPEYDTPLVSNMSYELKKFGVDKPVATVTAALVLSAGNIHWLYLFDGNKYCKLKMDVSITNQNCEWKPNKHFIGCDQVVRKNGFCYKKSNNESPEKPIEAEGGSPPDAANNKHVLSRNAGPSSRNDKQSDKTIRKSSGQSLLLDSILLILNSLILLIFK